MRPMYCRERIRFLSFFIFFNFVNPWSDWSVRNSDLAKKVQTKVLRRTLQGRLIHETTICSGGMSTACIVLNNCLIHPCIPLQPLLMRAVSVGVTTLVVVGGVVALVAMVVTAVTVVMVTYLVLRCRRGGKMWKWFVWFCVISLSRHTLSCVNKLHMNWKLLLS